MITQIKAHMNTSSGVQWLWFQASKKNVSCNFINRKCTVFLFNTIQSQQIATKIYFLVVISALYLLLSKIQTKKQTKSYFSHMYFVFVKGWALEGSFVQFLLMTLIQILDSHCLFWRTLNRQIKKEDLGKLAKSSLLMKKKGSKYNRFIFNYTQQLSICPIKSTLLPERNGSRNYSAHNCLISHRWDSLCHRPSKQSSTTAMARLPWQRPSSLPQHGKVLRYTGAWDFLLRFWHLLPWWRGKGKVVLILCTPQILVLFKMLPGY